MKGIRGVKMITALCIFRKREHQILDPEVIGCHPQAKYLFIFFCAVCIILSGCANAQPEAVSVTPTQSYTITSVLPSATPSPVPTETPVSTETLTPAPSPTPGFSEWIQVENWPAANQVRDILFDTEGNLWSAGPGGLLNMDPAGKMTAYTLDPADPEASQATSLAQSPDGAIWVGTLGHGLYRLYKGQWQSYTTDNGLPGNDVHSLAVGKDGKLWASIGPTRGQNNSAFFGYQNGEEWTRVLQGGWKYQRVIPAPTGEVWTFSSNYCCQTFFSPVFAYDPDTKRLIKRFDPNLWITAVDVGPKSDAWLATGNLIWHFQDGKWIQFVPPWEHKQAFVSSISIAKEKTAWFGLSNHFFDMNDPCGSPGKGKAEENWGVYLFQNNSWTRYTTKEGLADNQVCVIKSGPDGNIWVGTFDQGLSRFDGKEWKSYSFSSGMVTVQTDK